MIRLQIFQWKAFSSIVRQTRVCACVCPGRAVITKWKWGPNTFVIFITILGYHSFICFHFQVHMRRNQSSEYFFSFPSPRITLSLLFWLVSRKWLPVWLLFHSSRPHLQFFYKPSRASLSHEKIKSTP